MSSKITLGTAQFGLAYGVANTAGKPTLSTVEAILECARAGGIQTLDTAIAYGDSERVLGSAGVSDFRAISKLPQLPEHGDINVSKWVSAQIEGSLTRLKTDHLEGLLLHRPGQLLSSQGDRLYRALREQVAQGRVRRLGISIYEPSELDQLIARFALDIVQAPLNLWDARLDVSGWRSRLQRMGIALHARSVFLQGVLLMQADRRPAYFRRWEPLWSAWDAWLAEYRLTPLQACLRYVLHAEGVEHVVLGVDSPTQLLEILAVAGEAPLPDGYQGFQTQDAELLNPSLWKLE